MNMIDFEDLELGDYEIKTLLATEGFITDVQALRLKWNVPKFGFANDNVSLNAWHEGADNAVLAKELEALRKRYSLTERWRTALKLYFVTGDHLMLRAQSHSKIEFTETVTATNSYGKVDRSNREGIVISSSADLTRSEHDENYDYLHSAQPKKQPSYNFDRDHEIYLLSVEGLKVREIVDYWNENQHSGVLTEDAVRKIITRTSKKLNPGRSTSK